MTAAFDRRRPLARELEASVGDGFTVAVAGDWIAGRPVAPIARREPAVGAVARLLGGADLTALNLESAIVDLRTFTGHVGGTGGDWALVAPPEVARDLRVLGVRLVGRANNHALDWGHAGLAETGRRLDDAGIVHAGAGTTLAAARAPRYAETGAGRIALVSATTAAVADASPALDQFGAVPGRPG